MRESLQLALHMGLECTQQLMVRCTAGNLRMAEGMGMYVQQWACAVNKADHWHACKSGQKLFAVNVHHQALVAKECITVQQY